MVDVFREVRRVLRNDGVLWLNLGDSYTAGAGNRNGTGGSGLKRNLTDEDSRQQCLQTNKIYRQSAQCGFNTGLKPKDLVGIPWRVAFALQADGWYLRQDIIWHKPNPMPESVTDRCTKAHEYIFLLTKSARYYYDAEAIKEEGTNRPCGNTRPTKAAINGDDKQRTTANLHNIEAAETRNRRSVWTVATRPYKGAHFATFPPDLIEPCILAGTSAEGCCATCGAPWERILQKTGSKTYEYEAIGIPGESDNRGRRVGGCGSSQFTATGWQPTCTCDTTEKARCVVLDPFNGSGTTGEVARLAGCDYIGCELNDGYEKLARKRWEQGVML
jgi:DNA modification methylase